MWDKDAVRVEVNHSDRETVDIKQGEQSVTIRSRSLRGGPPRSLDYTISVPSWMAITVGGTYADVTMEGVGGDVSVRDHARRHQGARRLGVRLAASRCRARSRSRRRRAASRSAR